MPLALYMDGVQYSLVDRAVGIWMINLLTQCRHLIGVIRKKLICKCGCRGWRTFWPVLRFLRWSAMAMAEGAHPLARHDGSPFLDTEEQRRLVAGNPLSMPGVVLCLKGDWAEFCERFGLPSPSSGLRPCFCCAASGPDLYSPLPIFPNASQGVCVMFCAAMQC